MHMWTKSATIHHVTLQYCIPMSNLNQKQLMKHGRTSFSCKSWCSRMCMDQCYGNLMVLKSKLFISKFVAFALLHIQIYWELFGIYGQFSVYTPANTLYWEARIKCEAWDPEQMAYKILRQCEVRCGREKQEGGELRVSNTACHNINEVC